MAHEPAAKPFYSVLILAFFCSLLVAGAAVGLRPRQEANKHFDRQENILRAANLYQSDLSIEKLFEDIETKIVQLETGEFISPDQIDPKLFDQLKSAAAPATSRLLKSDEDIAGIGRVEQYSLVYIVKKNNFVEQVILPIRGKGLWSTMFGYVSLANDLNTIHRIVFYEHGETPGLGGEIENPAWQAGWQGKKLFDSDGLFTLKVLKGKVPGNSKDAISQVDGLTGATLTANGVTELLHFWFGSHGFKNFFDQIKTSGGLDG